MPLVVTLVHGTWAQDAQWVKPGSALRTAIQSRFSERVEFRPFYWSGRNSFDARMVAASALAAFIREGLEEFPNARHAVVAHSHGGNVVLRSLEDDMIRCRLSSLVTLSTPFIHVSARNIGAFIEYNVTTLRWLLAIIITASILWGAPSLRSFATALFHSNQPGQQQEYLGLGLLLLVFSWAAIRYPLIQWIEHAGAFGDKQLIRSVDDLPLLVIRSQADEASAALNFAYFLGWCATRLWRWLAAVPMFFRTTTLNWTNWKYQHPILGLIVALLVSWLVLILLLVAFGALGSIVGVDAGAPALLLALVFSLIGTLLVWYVYLPFLSRFLMTICTVMVGLLIFPLIVVLSIAILPFSPLDALFLGPLEITAEAAPAGLCRVFQLRAMHSDALRHSSPYTNPAALDACIEWIVIHR